MIERDQTKLEYSIIVPIYNAEAALDRCIKSILAQSFKDFELLLVDDGSTDQSLKKCNIYAAKDDRIRVIHQDNAGVSAARNRGLSEATGRYILFVDADDYIEVDYLNSFYNIDGDLVFTGFVIENEAGKEISKYKSKSEVINKSQINKLLELIEGPLINPVFAKRFSSEIININKLKFETTLDYGEDICFVIDYLACVEKICVQSKCSYHYVKYISHKTLSDLGINSLIIDKTEKLCFPLMKKLNAILCDNEKSKSTLARKYGKSYKTYVNLFLNGDSRVSKDTIHYLIKQHWYKESIKEPRLYEDESRLHYFIVRLNNYRILELYRRRLMNNTGEV